MENLKSKYIDLSFVNQKKEELININTLKIKYIINKRWVEFLNILTEMWNYDQLALGNAFNKWMVQTK